MKSVSRSKLPNFRKVGSDHVGYFRIPAGCLLLDKQNNWLAAGRDLNGAERNALGDHLAGRFQFVLSSPEANPHAVGFFGDDIRLLEKIHSGRRRKILPLWTCCNSNSAALDRKIIPTS